MKRPSLILSMLLLLNASAAFAQSTRFLSVPSSAFTPRTSEGATGNAGYGGNETGTARSFAGSSVLFAPVSLPHGATVTSMKCGGRAPSTDFRIAFTLRRNDPQQANVDMAVAKTTFDGLGFEFVDTNSIASPVVNNDTFNYYIVAVADTTDVGFCPNCLIGFCRIGYSGGS
jgi:hypothetical protein